MRRGGLVAAFVIAAFAACHGEGQRPLAPDPRLADVVAPPALVTPRACTPYVAPPRAAPSLEAPQRRAKAKDPRDLCETADDNLARAEREIRASNGGAVSARRTATRGAPARLARVTERLALTKAERALLDKNGFVVSDRWRFGSYAWALHEVHQSELPLWFSADALLHAVYASNDALVGDLERALAPRLAALLSALHCELPAAAASYPAEIARGVDLYLTVARSLLADHVVPSVLGVDGEAGSLVGALRRASGAAEVHAFGRVRVVDLSQYAPRGRYTPPNADDEATSDLSPYFRAVMFLSRFELNLVSRSSRSSAPGPTPDPRETPEEATVALALADLTARARQEADVTALERTFTALGGRREDVGISDLIALRAQAKIDRVDEAAFERLKGAVGDRFQRTARLHPMPEGSRVLPAIATFLGARVTADAAAMRPLVHAETPDRKLVGAADVAFVLGLDHARGLLSTELASYPALDGNLRVARARLAAVPDPGDLYSAWLGALRAGAAPTPAGAPQFMKTPAYQDLRVGTLTAGYAQLRHAYVLLAGQPYDEGGCVIPDAFVEPVPGLYDAVAEYARRGAAMAAIFENEGEGARAYFTRLGEIASTLATIARHELEGRALSDAERRFLSMVVEMTPGGTGEPPTYTGWYFDLFRKREGEALADASLVADYYTSADAGQIAYVGAGRPRLGVFVVDTGGEARAMVGPIASAYELTGPIATRYDDAAAARALDKRAPWTASHVAEAPRPPRVGVRLDLSQHREGRKGPITITVQAEKAVKGARVELLDHHRRVIASSPIRAEIGTAPVALAGVRSLEKVEGVRLRVGEASAEGLRGGPAETVEALLGGAWIEDGP